MGEETDKGWEGTPLCLQDAMGQARFLEMYGGAVQKVMGITEEVINCLETKYGREILSGISGRIKTPESAGRKLMKKGCDITLSNAVDKLNDIAGVRVTCYFLDDVYELARHLKKHNQLHFIKEKNYIERPKASGYKSLHLIAEVPVTVEDNEMWIKTEIQIRTLAMDFWARLDHRLCYKKDVKSSKSIQKDLREYADIISRVDVQMLSLRKRIDAL